ncbi:MAG: hypothetical protein WBM54_10330 [Woeseia sp.]
MTSYLRTSWLPVASSRSLTDRIEHPARLAERRAGLHAQNWRDQRARLTIPVRAARPDAADDDLLVNF